ncbi:hypothetical protein FMUND_2883 [Fusarium mundagurra]|uniref:Fucose-specific lectin n=1 Tax=Fusarium mundagurra TaxID=1567541 RepID=A0A8H5Z3A7_9HYPO|nr:hypothetical protein FMUND_2883 [Fusarium mundagurra]
MTFMEQQNLSNYVQGIGIYGHSSPAFDPSFLEWHGRTGDDGILFASFYGDKWGIVRHIDNVGIAPGTSPCVVLFNKVYVFWSRRVENETWYCNWEKSGWSPQRSVAAQIGGQGYYRGTSPTAIVQDDYNLRLFWVGSSGPDQGLWYSDHALNP